MNSCFDKNANNLFIVAFLHLVLVVTVQKFEEKRAAGLPLVPEEKKAKALSKQTS